jgi:hypothetical protein
MTSAWTTFWRRFFLVEKPTSWPASRIRRQPELAHIPPTDPYFVWPARIARLVRWDLPDLGVGIALAALFAWAYSVAYGLVVPVICASTVGNPIALRPWIAAAMAVAFFLHYASITAIVMWWMPGWFKRHNGRLRAELRRRSIPICIACGYEGGDIAAPRCPECGEAHPVPSP